MEIEVDVGVFDQGLQHRLQRVARIDRAVAIIDVVGQVAAGRPGEQHRRDIDARVVDDLREAIDGFLEAGVVSMNKDENPAPGNPPDPLVEVCLRLRQVDAVGPQDDEIALRIAGDRGRQRNVAGPARAVRRDGHDNVGEIEPASSRSAEHDARRGNDRRAGRRHHEIDPAGVGRPGHRNEGPEGTAGAAGGDRRERDREENADSGSARQGSSDRRARGAPHAHAESQPHNLNACSSRWLRQLEKASRAMRIRSEPARRTCRSSPAPPRVACS